MHAYNEGPLIIMQRVHMSVIVSARNSQVVVLQLLRRQETLTYKKD